jgi:hypothetical protein
MSCVVVYQPSGVVANRVISYLQSVNTPDYESQPNTLINPDVVSLLSTSTNYWKVVGSSVIEMTSIEKTTIDNFLRAKTTRERKYKIISYDVMNRIEKETWYDTDNGDGTYTGKAEETVFTFDGLTSTLLYKIIKTFYFDGTEETSTKVEYYRNTNRELIEKTI